MLCRLTVYNGRDNEMKFAATRKLFSETSIVEKVASNQRQYSRRMHTHKGIHMRTVQNDAQFIYGYIASCQIALYTLYSKRCWCLVKGTILV